MIGQIKWRSAAICGYPLHPIARRAALEVRVRARAYIFLCPPGDTVVVTLIQLSVYLEHHPGLPIARLCDGGPFVYVI